jgi:hypothetical protein
MTLDEQLIADRRRLWHDFSRFLFWGAVHAAVILIVVVAFAIDGPTLGTVAFGIILIGGNLLITTGGHMSHRR